MPFLLNTVPTMWLAGWMMIRDPSRKLAHSYNGWLESPYKSTARWLQRWEGRHDQGGRQEAGCENEPVGWTIPIYPGDAYLVKWLGKALKRVVPDDMSKASKLKAAMRLGSIWVHCSMADFRSPEEIFWPNGEDRRLSEPMNVAEENLPSCPLFLLCDQRKRIRICTALEASHVRKRGSCVRDYSMMSCILIP